ncbi:hypothetical protein [Kitasatospora sp. NPDC057015]|uniref:hypothetical protein n=1 Tax=Kitasatospora sp. NPDC057015 TaxID=3346001 RepID=UPI00362F4440
MTDTCAIYLRCHPRDEWEMDAHRRALENHATKLGLHRPAVYLDNGVPSRGPAPRRTDLAHAVRAGRYRVVLIPGRWVFSLDASTAHRIADTLAAGGCEIVELPPRH